jgi:predicted O-methyltransferase YrrM
LVLLFPGLRRRTNQILSAVNLREKGFYTPYDYLGHVQLNDAPYPEVEALFRGRVDRFRDFLAALDGLEAAFKSTATGHPQPNWTSRFISPLDGATIYGMVVQLRPARIIEIGSGNSTHFMARAVIDHELATDILCIDPAPRVAIKGLPVRLLRRVLSLDALPLVEALEPGDILFVDSSHILQPDFDVDIILNRLLPRLASGVVVHFHDIFLPYPYPREWYVYRFNEQNALIPWLLSGVLDPLFASHYVWRAMPDHLDTICCGFPLRTPANGGSLWLRKT